MEIKTKGSLIRMCRMRFCLELRFFNFSDYARYFTEVIPAIFLWYDKSSIFITVSIYRIRIQPNFLNFEAFKTFNFFNNLRDF